MSQKQLIKIENRNKPFTSLASALRLVKRGMAVGLDRTGVVISDPSLLGGMSSLRFIERQEHFDARRKMEDGEYWRIVDGERGGTDIRCVWSASMSNGYNVMGARIVAVVPKKKK